MEKFNSQICTSREQSERLLALGLKKETADCGIYYSELAGCDRMFAKIEYEFEADEIPAWSLHRLIEMCPDYIEENYFGVSAVDVSYYFGLCEGSIGYKFVREGGNLYDNIINCIEWLIKEGYFNREYLL